MPRGMTGRPPVARRLSRPVLFMVACALTALVLSSCARPLGRAPHRSTSESGTPVQLAAPGRIFAVGDRVRSGVAVLAVASFRRTRGSLRVASGSRRPKPADEWLVVNVAMTNESSRDADISELSRFRLGGRGDLAPASMEVDLATSKGLDSSGTLRPRGQVSLNLNFEVPKGEDNFVLRFRPGAKEEVRIRLK